MTNLMTVADKQKLTSGLQDVARKLETMDRLWDELHSKVIAGSFDEQRDALAALRSCINLATEDVSDLLAEVRP